MVRENNLKKEIFYLQKKSERQKAKPEHPVIDPVTVSYSIQLQQEL